MGSSTNVEATFDSVSKLYNAHHQFVADLDKTVSDWSLQTSVGTHLKTLVSVFNNKLLLCRRMLLVILIQLAPFFGFLKLFSYLSNGILLDLKASSKLWSHDNARRIVGELLVSALPPPKGMWSVEPQFFLQHSLFPQPDYSV